MAFLAPIERYDNAATGLGLAPPVQQPSLQLQGKTSDESAVRYGLGLQRKIMDGLSAIFNAPGAEALMGGPWGALGAVRGFHFSPNKIEGLFNPGTFFAENPASVEKLRAGLGNPGEEGYFTSHSLDAQNSLDLSDWDKARKLLKGVKARGWGNYANVPASDFGNPMRSDFKSVTNFWDRLFNDKEATSQLVRSASKAGHDALTYETAKDKAERVWLAVKPEIVKKDE